MSESVDMRLYLGIDTKFVRGRLTNDVCPLCLGVADEFDVHHVVWRVEGGSNDPVNLLPICRSCHALLTHGAMRERHPRDMAAFYHQLARHGTTFLARAINPSIESVTETNREIARSFESGGQFDRMTMLEQQRVDAVLRKTGRTGYRFHRDVIRGVPDAMDDYQRWANKANRLAETVLFPWTAYAAREAAYPNTAPNVPP